MKFCKIQKADFFIFSENLHFQFYNIICPNVRTWKKIFRFWLEADLLHFFSLKNSQKLYKWGVTILRKNVRWIVKGHINHADKMNLHRRFKSTMSPFVEKFFWGDTCFLAKNVRCTVERAHDAVNKNFTIERVSIRRKNVRCKVRRIKTQWKFTENLHLRCHHLSKNCPFSVKVKNFFDRIPAFWRKNVRCNMKGKNFFGRGLKFFKNLSVVKWKG